MQRGFTQITLLAAVLSLPLVATSDDKPDIMFTVQGLHDFCNAAPNSRESLMCITYISGVIDLMELAGQVDKGQRRDATQLFLGICPQSFASYGAAVQVFQNWAVKHPENWGWQRSAGVAVALRESWPCT